MASPVGLTSGQLMIDPSAKVLKSQDYADYLESEEIIRKARDHAREILEQSRQAYEKEKQRGFEEGLAESKVDQAEQMLKVVSRTINYLSEVEKALADILMSGIKKLSVTMTRKSWP